METVNQRRNSAVYLGLCFEYLAEINKPHLPNQVKEPRMAEGVLLNSEHLLNLLGTCHIKLNLSSITLQKCLQALNSKQFHNFLKQISFKSTQLSIQLSPLLLRSHLNCWIYSAEIIELPSIWKFDWDDGSFLLLFLSWAKVHMAVQTFSFNCSIQCSSEYSWDPLPVWNLKVIYSSSSVMPLETWHRGQQIYHCSGNAGTATFSTGLQYTLVMLVVVLNQGIAESLQS